MSETRPVVVSVDPQADAPLEEIAERLRTAGMSIERVLEPIGAVTGTAPAEAISALESVPGVSDVDTQREHRLAPPSSDLQ